MLRLENICWGTPDGKDILKDLSLTLNDGRLAVITGPNGSGKTTLAKIIAGIEKPTSGRIYLDDTDITDLDVTQRATLGVSFAFQQPVRFKGITVRQLIEIASNGKLSEMELCEILGKVGLCAKNYLDREVNSTLSGGEIKRIEIATVLARHTKLTVFDEPEAGIDLWSFKSLIQVFEGLHSSLKGNMVIISHQERILKIADEIILIADGKVQSQGKSDEMIGSVMQQGIVNAKCCKQEEMFSE